MSTQLVPGDMFPSMKLNIIGVQPPEFVTAGKGRVMAFIYSNSPVGRMDPAETLVLLKVLANARKNR